MSLLARGQSRLLALICLLPGSSAKRRYPLPSPGRKLPCLCLIRGLCVPPLAGGSGIHRPVAKKATPGAEYKAKVRGMGRDRTPGKGRGQLCPSPFWRGTLVEPDSGHTEGPTGDLSASKVHTFVGWHSRATGALWYLPPRHRVKGRTWALLSQEQGGRATLYS